MCININRTLTFTDKLLLLTIRAGDETYLVQRRRQFSNVNLAAFFQKYIYYSVVEDDALCAELTTIYSYTCFEFDEINDENCRYAHILMHDAVVVVAVVVVEPL